MKLTSVALRLGLGFGLRRIAGFAWLLRVAFFPLRAILKELEATITADLLRLGTR
jgi:hypothetical protein